MHTNQISPPKHLPIPPEYGWIPKQSCKLTTGKVLIYISWQLFKRKVKAKSAEVYVSGLRCLHLINGYKNPSLRPGIVKIILNGQNNLDKLMERIESKSKRVKETIPILKRT